ncbi:carbon monoxide dehydrogenase subunit G [Pollutimonas bauzanensis]|uniref:CoxG family protein n=1 Tax=Pollutimonas bauzanensis TaxID=658167 RepID=UPI003341F3EA
MELQDERFIPATLDVTWAALNDPAILKECIAGCETLERTEENAFVALVSVKVGPVSARFKGNLKMTNVQPPHSYTIHFDGQGGVAGFGKGSADVSLVADGEKTRLNYTARAQVGGKIAQIGSRLVDAAAAKLSEDFFKAFEQRLQALAKPEDGAITAVKTEMEAAAKPVPEKSRKTGLVWWVSGAMVVLVVAYLIMR